jgi:molybdenum cofactor synthesis domain-containing protein
MKPLEDARREVMASVKVTPVETISTWDALGRVLAEDVEAPESVPPWDNSAMDGFAVRAADVADPGAVLVVVGDLPAGVAPSVPVGPGEAVKIMTGAPIPDGADTVVKVEDTDVVAGKVTIHPAVDRGTAVRPSGGDLQQGQSVFHAGVALTPMHIGVLATLGLASLPVHRRPRVAFMSTGDELVPIGGGDLGPGQIRDSNRPMLAALLDDAGVEAVDLGVVRDDESELRRALDAAAAHDAVLTTGGVSMGDYDVTKLLLSGEEGIDFWKIAIQPAKPFAFGHLGEALFFGLPGNPVSALVSFEQLVRPALLAMSGARRVLRPRATAIAGEDLDTDPEKTVFLRVTITGERDGLPVVVGSGGQGSNVLSAAAAADALAVIPVGTGLVGEGETVTIERFHDPATREYDDGG